MSRRKNPKSGRRGSPLPKAEHNLKASDKADMAGASVPLSLRTWASICFTLSAWSAMRHSFVFLSVAILLGGCTAAVRYVPSGEQGVQREWTAPVDIYHEAEDVPPGSAAIGEFSIDDTGFSIECEEKARQQGADTAYILSFRTPDVWSTCYRLKARLLRYPDRNSATSIYQSDAARIIRIRPIEEPPPGASVLSSPLPAAVMTVRAGEAQGTAFFISSEGWALTSHHVVQGHTRVRLALHDGAELSAEVIRHNTGTDMALLKSDCGNPCPALPLATTTPEPGVEINVIGSPLGLSHTITRGIVSGVRRTARAIMIQTDAAINQGNSGGPMIQVDNGHVVGVVTMKISDGATEGIGFAVDLRDALRSLGVVIG